MKGYPFVEVEVVGRSRGTFNIGNLRAAAKLSVATMKCLGALRRFKPNVVLGTGGYVSLPAALAARILRIPLVLHEQNSVPGLANRVARRFARRVGVSFPGSEKYFGAAAELVGNPVRADIVIYNRSELRGKALEHFGLEAAGRKTLLVFGGSQGAQSINRTVAAARKMLITSELQVLHLCGNLKVEDTLKFAYGVEEPDEDPSYRVVASTDRMELAYAAADLALCRAGASTLAELAAVGLPAILVPLPFSLDDDQRKNAEVVAGAGGARILLDADLRPETLAELVAQMLGDPEELIRMAAAITSLHRPDAAERMADLVEEVAR
jgi:UDP-N-acetylglucosamine--N-acetylmuramyl-(pentapeptide) pyrophosphoryl-undecaprenol N-acetylglucosamine transferase